MNHQQGRTEDTSKKDESQRRATDAQTPNAPKGAGEKKTPDERATNAGGEGQQHGGSGRGMKRDDAESGTEEKENKAGAKPFGDVRKTENQGAESTDAAEKSKDASKSAAGAADRKASDGNQVNKDENEGDTGPKTQPN
ncbi:MAG: hypothetical protein ACO1OB_24775 [Archangium sp.]